MHYTNYLRYLSYTYYTNYINYFTGSSRNPFPKPIENDALNSELPYQFGLAFQL